jgi:hypothetical protein
MEYLGAWGTLIYEKKLRSKISCQTPFKYVFSASPLLALVNAFAGTYVAESVSTVVDPTVFRVLAVPGVRPLTFSHCGKAWSLGRDLALLHGPNISSMGESKMSHPQDRKTFPAWENEQNLFGRRVKCSRNGKLKQKSIFYSVTALAVY